MIFLKLLARLIKVLRAGPSPAQIAGGFVLGMLLGFLPFPNLYAFGILLLVLLLDVNLSAVILGWTFFGLLSYLLDPLFHRIGLFFLVDVRFLKGFWTWLYNLPLMPLTRFNNTVVLGSLVCGLVFLGPVYFLARKGILYYREKLDSKIQQLRIIQVIKGSSLYSTYVRIRNLADFSG
jgi:uncharacterized protein (TIGR03546 family)